MPNLATFAERVWYALHCLPRDPETNAPPSRRSLEVDNGLALATISKIVHDKASRHQHQTIVNLAKALRVSTDWLYNGGDDAPTPTGMIPPMPREPKADGTVEWERHGDLPQWEASVLEALRKLPELVPGAYLAGAEMPVVRRIDTATAEVAHYISGYAWAISTLAERRKFGKLASRADRPSGRVKASKTVARPSTRGSKTP